MNESAIFYTTQSQNRLLEKLVSRLKENVNNFLINDQNFQLVDQRQLTNYVLLISIHIFVSQLRGRIENWEKILYTIFSSIFTEPFLNDCLLDYKLINYALESFYNLSSKFMFLDNFFNNLDNLSLLDSISTCLSLLIEITTYRYEHGAFYTPDFITSFIIDSTFNLFVFNEYEKVSNIPNFNKEKSIEENYKHLTQCNDKKGFLDLLLTTSLVDPAAGTGYFFITALNLFSRLIEKYIKEFPQSEDKKEVLRNFVNFAINYCYGYDIDNYAVLVARIRIFLSIIKSLLILNKNFLFNNLDILELPQNIFVLDTLLKNISIPQGKFVIVSNPPWGANINTNLENIKRKFKVATGQFDIWSIFLERMIDLLSQGSILGVIIPNTLVNNPNYENIRGLILKETHIDSIINLGDNIFDNVTQPVMVLVLQKIHSDHESLTRVLDTITDEQRYQLKNYFITLWDQTFVYEYTNQCLWKRNSTLEFQIFGIRYEDFINTVENGTIPLKNVLINARGVEIGKKGKVILCPQCLSYNPPLDKKIVQKSCSHCGFLLISNNLKEECIINKNLPNYKSQSLLTNTFYHPIFLGQHIHRFYVQQPHYINLSYKGINYKKESEYIGPKLLLAKTGHNISVYVDETDTYTLQVVYIFHIKDSYLKYYSYYALTGILNSAVLYTYYYRKYADINRKQFPHFIQTRILKIPIPIFDSSNREVLFKISTLAKILQQSYQILNNLKDRYQELILPKNSYIKKTFFTFLLEPNILVDSSLDTINQLLVEKELSNLYIDLEEDNNIVIGYIEMNKYVKLIKLRFKSSVMTLIAFLTLSYQKNNLKKSNIMIKELFERKIFYLIPKSVLPNMLDNWYKEHLFNNDISNIGQSYSSIQSILPSELLLNDLVLQLYNLNDLKYKKHLLYSFVN